MATSQEQWEYTLQGNKHFGASGSRDVLILVSNVPDGPQVVPRKKGELTQQDKDRLTSEGISLKCWEDDAKLMRERHMKDSNCLSVAIDDVTYKKKKHVLDRIAGLFNHTTACGVIIHYIGPGKKDTGDWCASDDFIALEDITNLYIQLFTGRVMSIIADCSYSGQWVEYCKEFLDKCGVQPCGHSAREKGIKLKVCCSCLPDQIGTSLLYSARGSYSDKNTGKCGIYCSNEITPDQKTYVVDFTEITCNKLPDETCALSPRFTFQEKKNLDRICLVRGEDRGRPAWRYVLLVDDPDIIHMFREKTIEGNIDVADYGLVLKSGWGQDPPQEIKDWLEQLEQGYKVLQFTS